MSSKTVSYRLGDLTDWLSGGTPSKKNPEYWGDDIPWISASSMGGSRYSSSDLKITKKGLEAGSRLALEGSILLLVRGSTLHNRIPVGIAERDVAFNQDVKAIRVKPKLIARQVTDEMYVYYWLKANEQRLLEMVEHTGIGAGKLDTKRLQNLEIHLPSWPEQRKIVASATAIDEKEILNSRINQTLEQMAQAIFKSWFVDFEPVKAKIAALEAGGSEEDALLAAMQAISGKGEAELTRLQTEQPEQYTELRATAELFPSAMQDSELGEIPEGWEPAPLSELFELHRGFDLPQKSREEGPYEVYAAGGLHGTHSQYKMEPPGIITGRSGVIGNVYLSLKKYWPLNTTLYVRQFRSSGPYYAYHLLKTLDLKSLNSGSAVPSLNRNFVHSIAVLNPGSAVLNKFENLSSSLFEQIVQNIDQSKLLSTLRDTLLSKLLSGELSISGAEYKLTEAAETADV